MRRRARPLLGTLVEVRARHVDQAGFERASEAAFAVVAQVQRLMSVHAADSDLSRIARAHAGERLRVHAHTAAVLRRALRWARLSGGAFDAGCAPRAVARGWLPAPAGAAPPGPLPFEQALVLRGHELEVRAPVWLDFGGIAKGYAVDRAVAALRRAGVADGVVNAGGDLRVFGAEEAPVLLRSPFDHATLWPVAALRDAACATSASGTISPRAAAATDAAANGAPDALPPRSVTVFAPTACAADALTKIVWQQGLRARPLLRRARARALVIEADGRVWRS